MTDYAALVRDARHHIARAGWEGSYVERLADAVEALAEVPTSPSGVPGATIPTTDQIRDVYHVGALNAPPDITVDEAMALFDRWLTAHDTDVAEHTIREHSQTVADTMRDEFGKKIVELLTENERLSAKLRLNRERRVKEREALARRIRDYRSERDEALAALGVSRQRYADSETKRAELEAVIQKVRDALQGRPAFSNLDSIGEGIIRRIVEAPPSVVLQDRDAAVWDNGFTACAHEHMRQQSDPAYPIHRTNPYRSREATDGH